MTIPRNQLKREKESSFLDEGFSAKTPSICSHFGCLESVVFIPDDVTKIF